MSKVDFDNLLKTIKGSVLLAGGNTISIEIDFELPRGYIAKLKNYQFKLRDLHEDIEGTTGAKHYGVHMALLRDPDDANTILIPNNSVGHDVVDEFSITVNTINVTVGWSVVSALRKFIPVFKENDLITARNMRFNAVGVGAQAADLTESLAEVIIQYTLERVSDADVLELLDIL